MDHVAGNRREIAAYASMCEEEGIEALVAAWRSAGRDMIATELAELATEAGIELDSVKMRDGAYSSRSMGTYLASLKGRRFEVDGYELALKDAGERAHATLWRLDVVRAVSRSGDASSAHAGPKIPAT